MGSERDDSGAWLILANGRELGVLIGSRAEVEAVAPKRFSGHGPLVLKLRPKPKWKPES